MSDIKQRLKLAYENVAFYADKTWTHEPVAYQRANQELYARGTHLDELFLEESSRPRTVLDSIPQSKLAQYANYEYNESRELSYASNVTDVSFYYPCLYQKSAITEPWMLPEVEQLFIWLAYSPQFELSSPKHLGDLEDLKNIEDGQCSCPDLHRINPAIYETFERTPGKARFTQTRRFTREDESVSTVIKLDDFDEMKLRMYLKQDKIKEIWERNAPPSKTNKMLVFKSSLDNYFVHETPKQHKGDYTNISNIPHYFNDLQEKSHDFRNMQSLVDSLSLEIKATIELDSKSGSATKLDADGEVKTEVTPTRRLYSDVVQGLSPNKANSLKTRHSDVTSPSSTRTSTKDTPLMSPKTTTSTCFSTEDSAASSPQKTTKAASWQTTNKTWLKTGESFKILTTSQDTKSRQSGNFIYSKPKTPPQSTGLKTPVYSTISYADSFGSSYCPLGYNSPWSSLNAPLGNFMSNEFQPNDVYSCNAFSNTYQSSSLLNSYTNNFYGSPYQYSQSNLYSNAFTAINYSGCSFQNTYTNSNATQQANAANSRTLPPQSARSTYSQNAVQMSNPAQQAWLLQQYRPPMCNVPHFSQPYFLLPQPVGKSSQRWSQPHYIRPSTPQNFHVTVSPQTPPPYWNIPSQGLYRTNSNQQVFNPVPHQTFDSSSSANSLERQKKLRKTLQTKISPNRVTLEYSSSTNCRLETNCRNKSNSTSKRSSVSSDASFPVPQAPEAKPKATCEYKYIFKKEQSSSSKSAEQRSTIKIISSLAGSLKGFSFASEGERPCLIPVTETASEELERQALDEYQPSNENFYKDLEAQAEEQYEESSENSVSPPSDQSTFGGLPLVQRLLTVDLVLFLALYININSCFCDYIDCNCLFALS